METLDILLRLAAATVISGAVGLDRDLHGRPTGVRTLGIVGLGSALAVLAMSRSGTSGDTSRVIQGILTGIGFLGAGVIVRAPEGYHIQGLTTAACTWLTGCIGAVCALAQWWVLAVGVPLIFLVLIFGGTLEEALHRRWPQEPKPDD